MDGPKAALACAALLVAIISRRNARGLCWIVVGALFFVLTDAYAQAGLRHPPSFNGIVDACMCLMVMLLKRTRWESWLIPIWLASMGISIVQFTVEWPSHYWYVTCLEAANWAALFVIGYGSLTVEPHPYESGSEWIISPVLRDTYRALGRTRQERRK